MKALAQGHTATKQQSQGWNSGSSSLPDLSCSPGGGVFPKSCPLACPRPGVSPLLAWSRLSAPASLTPGWEHLEGCCQACHNLGPRHLLLSTRGCPAGAQMNRMRDSNEIPPFTVLCVRARFCAEHFALRCFIYTSPQPWEVETHICSFLQMRKLRPREVKCLARGPTVIGGRAGRVRHDPRPEWGWAQQRCRVAGRRKGPCRRGCIRSQAQKYWEESQPAAMGISGWVTH